MTNTDTAPAIERIATHANFYEWFGTYRIDIGYLDSEGTIQVTDTFITGARTLPDAAERYPGLIWDEVQW